MIPTILFLGLYSMQICAWPAFFLESSAIEKTVKRSEDDHPCPHMKEHSKRQAPGVTPPFDAAQQYVSNTGTHRFVAPGPNDQRGPCKQGVVHSDECYTLICLQVPVSMLWQTMATSPITEWGLFRTLLQGHKMPLAWVS